MKSIYPSIADVGPELVEAEVTLSIDFDSDLGYPNLLSFAFVGNYIPSSIYLKWLIHSKGSGQRVPNNADITSEHGAVEIAFEEKTGRLAYIELPISIGRFKICENKCHFVRKTSSFFNNPVVDKSIWKNGSGHFGNVCAAKDVVSFEIFRKNRSVKFFWGPCKGVEGNEIWLCDKFCIVLNAQCEMVGFFAMEIDIDQYNGLFTSLGY